MALSLKNVRVAISCKKREFVVHSMWHYRCTAERDMLDFVAEPILHPDQNYKNLLPPSSNKNNEECLVKTFLDHKSKDFFHMKGIRNKRCQIPIQHQQTMEKNDWDNKWLIDYNVRFLISHFSNWSKRWVIPVQNTWTVKLVLPSITILVTCDLLNAG